MPLYCQFGTLLVIVDNFFLYLRKNNIKNCSSLIVDIIADIIFSLNIIGNVRESSTKYQLHKQYQNRINFRMNLAKHILVLLSV